MKSIGIVNNLAEHKKCLEIHKVPSKYYEPKNNVNIRNYLTENVIKFHCETDSYLTLNQFIDLIESIKRGNINDFQKINNSLPWNQDESYYPNNNVIPQKNNWNYNIVNQKDVILIENTSKNMNHMLLRDDEKIRNQNYRNKDIQAEPSNFRKANINYDETKETSTCASKYKIYEYKLDLNPTVEETNYRNHKSAHTLQPKDRLNTNQKNTHEHSIDNTIHANNVNNVNQSSATMNIILNDLLTCRKKLSDNANIADPEKIISMKNLKIMLLHRPRTLDAIKNLKLVGFGDDKVKKYGYQFLEIIRQFK